MDGRTTCFICHRMGTYEYNYKKMEKIMTLYGSYVIIWEQEGCTMSGVALKIKVKDFSSLRKALTKSSGVIGVKKTVEEIEKELGISDVKPIYLSGNDDIDAKSKGDCFAEWYEEELRELYDQQ